MMYNKFLLFCFALIFSACSREPHRIKKNISNHAKESFVYGDRSFVSDGTLDYEDAIRDKCSRFSKNEYRYYHNTNYRNGWIEASKKC